MLLFFNILANITVISSTPVVRVIPRLKELFNVAHMSTSSDNHHFAVTILKTITRDRYTRLPMTLRIYADGTLESTTYIMEVRISNTELYDCILHLNIY